MAQTFDDAARDAARELRIRIERDLADGRFLPSADDEATVTEPARALAVRAQSRRRPFRLTGRRA